MFQKRLKNEKEIHLHEFLYPLMQGYDSTALGADIEIGGTDQTFNMLIGRDLMKVYQNKEKIVITTPLLINPKTGRKLMSKSEDGYVGLDNPPNEMYGKIMALPDEVIILCFKLCTFLPSKMIEKIKKDIKDKKLNPRDAKAKLAYEIVSFYHGKALAQKAEEEFNKVFKEKKMPSAITKTSITHRAINILDLLMKAKLTSSKSEARRLILQKGVKIDGRTQEDWRKIIEIKKGMVIQVGKRKFIKIT
jgi:tyrosyl-tRNA synthetase